jgi:hypothetical protein
MIHRPRYINNYKILLVILRCATKQPGKRDSLQTRSDEMS